ncbi:DUF2163 domain-containing protein [Tardiphaga sp. 538_B7_N1_4]|jgi:uncharacterized phage protein (TIGR02218 family)|uniref:DUF2163 domain-containing protein n=1 Tax=Tardiphaga sp. 538_B7_N1_4 TaxID=3240778 RepID=UPI003F1F90E0
MRSIPPALQARLDSGVTTLAQVWKLTRRDGVVAGFTDHDCDLVMDGVTYRAGTGLAASEATSRFDLSVDGGDIAGALDDDILTDADLAAGRYDAAQVETWLVDWSDTLLRVLTARGTLGEVKREGTAFIAELRGLAALLSQESGRLYTARCSADLGDGKCRINLAGWQGTGAVEALEGVSMFSASGLGAFADDLFTAGRLTWTSGGNAGLAMEVKQHRVTPGHVRLSLWQTMPEPIATGDAFTVTAGCDKTLATCRDRFGNVDNFRGFPDIPGNDFVMSYPTPGRGGMSG